MNLLKNMSYDQLISVNLIAFVLLIIFGLLIFIYILVKVNKK